MSPKFSNLDSRKTTVQNAITRFGRAVKKPYWSDKKSSAIFMDFSKAFNIIDHSLLRTKLRAYGFSVTSLKFILSYLKNRKQRTVIKNSYSS